MVITPVDVMQLQKIALSDTKAFSPFFLDYIQQKETLKPFYNLFPTVENFNKQLTDKSNSFAAENREVLVRVLQRQYKNITLHDAVKQNISSLAEANTFTITTGHQLNIFTGPLYFIYKIVTVINTCKQLKEKYPAYNFVPVYWMATEDHDYDEIKYFRLYGKKYTWETNQQGAVGRFNTKGLETLIQNLPGDVTLFKDAYQKNQKLSDAVRQYVNSLFSAEGLVALDADDRDLKSLFKNVIKEDILQNTTVKLVEKTNASLEALGYKTQIYCRDINFFYLDKQLRSRIEKKDNGYTILETSLNLTEEQLLDTVEREPEKFSPNVILRPLYQEVILPNLGYVGGPAEVIYWLQLKNVFDHFKVPFPILLPRNFGLVIDHQVYRKFEKTGLEISVLFEGKNHIFNHWITKNSHHNLTVDAEQTALDSIFSALKLRAESIDKTLGPFISAERKRALDSLATIEKKLLRAEKRLHNDKLRQIESAKDALFPNGSLQERTDNFLNFYQQDNQFIAKLIKHFNPFEFNFNVLIYPA
jgi:bacillithiol biosynthesis cysteine-adding enzyme BshC